jgi:hypothetical protein
MLDDTTDQSVTIFFTSGTQIQFTGVSDVKKTTDRITFKKGGNDYTFMVNTLAGWSLPAGVK